MIYTNNFKQFSKQSLFLAYVSQPYRSGYTPSGGFKTFKKLEDGKIYEIFFNKELNKNDKKELTGKIDFEWLKTYKKVYDIKVILEKEMDIIKHKNKKGEYIKEKGKEVWIQQISSFNIQEFMLSLGIIDEIPTLSSGKLDRNFEEELILKLKGNFLWFNYSGEKLETRYTFRPGKKFEILDENGIEIDINNKDFKKKEFDINEIWGKNKGDKDIKLEIEKDKDEKYNKIKEENEKFEEDISGVGEILEENGYNIKKDEEENEFDLPF